MITAVLHARNAGIVPLYRPVRGSRSVKVTEGTMSLMIMVHCHKHKKHGRRASYHGGIGLAIYGHTVEKSATVRCN